MDINMLPFNAALFRQQYPTLFAPYTSMSWSDEQLLNIWNNEALVAGSKVLAMLHNNTPWDSTTNTVRAWNATTNTPTLSNSTGVINDRYLCTVAGTVNFGAGPVSFSLYDIVDFNSLLMQWINIGEPYTYYWAGLILAHLISLYNRPIVGRLGSATEGDVSGQFDYQDTLTSQWWNQSTYGARVWKLLLQRGGFTAFVNNPFQGILNQGNNNVYGNH